MRGRRVQVLAGAVLLALLGTFTVLMSAGATGGDAEHCVRLALQSQVRERMVTGHGERIVVIGDSYSVGLGLRDPDRSWPSRLPGRVHVFGFSGSGFSQDASGCPGASYADRAPHAMAHGASLVVVEGGLNDYDQPTADLREGFRRLVGELGSHPVLGVGPPAAPARAAAALRVDEVLREESVRAGVQYLSMGDRYLPYLDDRLHLTPAGHRAFGSIVAAAITATSAGG
jgi:acyl-CoA thioesterase-1